MIGTSIEDALGFQATETPAWRQDSDLLPPCSQMLSDLSQWLDEQNHQASCQPSDAT